MKENILKTSKEEIEVCQECEDGIIPNSICSFCCGSGEGQHDGATCINCKGNGSIDEYCDCTRGNERCVEEVF